MTKPDEAHQQYEIDLLKRQVAMLEEALNQTLRKLDLPAIQLPKSAYQPHR